MTEEKAILAQIQMLPEQLKQEALHYIQYLQEKHAAQKSPTKKKRKAGSAEGKYKLAPDFDAPLEDFR